MNILPLHQLQRLNHMSSSLVHVERTQQLFLEKVLKVMHQVRNLRQWLNFDGGIVNSCIVINACSH